jgi:hypothetical protein
MQVRTGRFITSVAVAAAERSYLSAAIVELNKAHNVMKGTY